MNREQLAKECKEIEKAGGSVLDFLRLRGCISPWGTWYRLQKEELNRAEHQITDGKGVGDMRKITLEQKKKAVEIAIGGGDPLEYLGECGSESPDKLWWYIKNCLKKAQPDLYAQIPSGRKKAADKQKNEPVTEVEPPPQPVTDLKVETVDDDLKIYGLTSRIGDFQAAGGNMAWYDNRGNIMLNIPVATWRQLMKIQDGTWKELLEIVPKVMQTMGL